MTKMEKIIKSNIYDILKAKASYHYKKNSFYTNSFYIGLSRILAASCGFLFWVVAARYYSVADVGIATALNSSLGLVLIFSSFGLDISLIRFITIREKNTVFNTCLLMTLGLSFIGSITYIELIDIISPSLLYLKNYYYIFITFVVINSISMILNNALLSFKEGKAYLIQNLLLASRIPILIILAAYGSIGIFLSIGCAYFIASFFGLIRIRKDISLKLKIDGKFAKETLKFTMLNYLGNILNAFPSLFLPILVLNMLGAEEAAKYYIAFAISSIIFIIPESMSMSFFIECNQSKNLRRDLIKSLTGIFSLLLPIVLIMIIGGESLISLFGTKYTEASGIIKILALSSFFVAFYNLFIPLQNIRMHPERIVSMNLAKCIILMSLSYVFILKFGIIGIGYAWTITYLILSLNIIYQTLLGTLN